jgi:hypothetical protein
MNAEDIIQNLLNNPYPHDLMKIRKLAESYETEEDAKERMVAYCTTEFLVDALHEHYAAQNLAWGWLREHQSDS